MEYQIRLRAIAPFIINVNRISEFPKYLKDMFENKFIDDSKNPKYQDIYENNIREDNYKLE